MTAGVGGRRIVANLDAEAELAALASGRKREEPSRAAREAAAGLGTLLRVFGDEGDRLWTVAPVDSGRVVAVVGLPRVTLESGDRRGGLPPVVQELVWMPTPGWEGRREKSEVGPRERSEERPGRRNGPPWPPSAPAAVVRRVADRTWGLAVAERLGFVLPGAVVVRSVAATEAAAAALGGRPWIVKAAFSAAGRDRLWEMAGAERFFARHGRGVFEPWVEREADFGVVGEVLGDQVEGNGVHRLLVDPRGHFRGIELFVGRPGVAPGLEEHEHAALWAAFQAAGTALAAEGFRGPFGLDAFRYRTERGEPAFHPWVELNPRLSFGRVARELVDRLAPYQGWAEAAVMRFETGRHPPEGATLLLKPAGTAPGAWLVEG